LEVFLNLISWTIRIVVENIKVDIKGKNGIISCSPNILKLIREKFSIKNPSYQSRKYVDRIYAITPSGVFQIGIWHEIEGFIRSLGIVFKIALTDEFKQQFTPSTKITKISTIEGFDYYDYQEDTLKEFIEVGRGISLLATGSGKALIAGGLCKSFLDHNPKCKILISVPNTYLLNQLYNSFIDEFKIYDVTMWGDKNIPDLTKNIIIANNQILTSDIKYTLSVVQNFDVVIVDEVHRVGDKKSQIGKVIHNIHTPNKFGLTGTLPDNIMVMWNVIGKIGPILYEKNSYDIRKKGAITDIEVNVVVCSHNIKPTFVAQTNEPTEMYNFELDYIMNLPSRNEVVRKIVHSLQGNILVLVDRLDYGRILYDILQKEDRKVFFIQGDTPTEERNMITSLMEKESGIIVIAMSTIFSTGVSVKNLHYAVFTYIGKSTVKIVQSIGRTVRKHETKNKSIIFDIADNLNYSYKHLRERIKIYKKQKIDFKISNIKI